MFGSIFYEGKGRGGKIEQILLPPKLGEFGGSGGFRNFCSWGLGNKV
jgi:hypothetical protein